MYCVDLITFGGVVCSVLDKLFRDEVSTFNVVVSESPCMQLIKKIIKKIPKNQKTILNQFNQ